MKAIPDYERKYTYLYRKQNGRCALIGMYLCHGKIDMHHVLPDTKTNRKLYPHYIHSLWNLQLVLHGPHLWHPKPKPPPYHEIAAAERLLIEQPGIEWRINMQEALKGIKL
jgi:hypothetical protein